MPTYTFRYGDEKRTFNRTMSISEMEEFLAGAPEVSWVPKAGLPTLDSVRLGIRKPDDNFRDLLKTIKKGSPGSDVNTF